MTFMIFRLKLQQFMFIYMNVGNSRPRFLTYAYFIEADRINKAFSCAGVLKNDYILQQNEMEFYEYKAD